MESELFFLHEFSYESVNSLWNEPQVLQKEHQNCKYQVYAHSLGSGIDVIVKWNAHTSVVICEISRHSAPKDSRSSRRDRLFLLLHLSLLYIQIKRKTGPKSFKSSASVNCGSKFSSEIFALKLQVDVLNTWLR